MKSDIVKRSVLCSCGGDIFERTVDISGPALVQVWRCCNCNAETPRRRGNTPTTARRAVDAYLRIRAAWQPVEDALDALVAAGAPSGCLLAHSAVFNYALRRLSSDGETLKSRDIPILVGMAQADLQRAAAFVAERQAQINQVAPSNPLDV